MSKDSKRSPEEENLNPNPRYSELFETDVDDVFTKTDYDDLGEDAEQQTDEEKRKKRIRYTLIIVGIIFAILIIVYIWGVVYYKSHFFPQTDVNGVDVGGQTVEEAVTTLRENIESRQVLIEGDSSPSDSNIVTSKEIDLTFNNEFGDLDKLLDQQDAYYWEIHALTHESLDLHTYYYYDEDKLNEIVSNLSVVSGPGVTPPENAKISYNGSEFVIDPAVEGNQPNVDKLKEAIVDCLLDDEKALNLKDAGIYNKPEITASNETLKSDLEKLNTALNARITINFPSQQVVLDKSIFHGWLKTDGNGVTVDDNLLNTYVSQLAQQFDNNGADISFRATNGRTYTFQNRSGWELDQAAEAAQLKQQILEGAVETEDPIWANQGSNALTGKTVSGTYIEISIAAQTLWYYRNNTLVSYSTIVSGNVGSNNATMTGLYFLQSKDSNVNLVVRQLDGNMVNTQVRYWLPYSQNFGIESATWRQDFGGDIYRTQGTDGDIDAPLDMAQTLYNNADVGTPVVIY